MDWNLAGCARSGHVTYAPDEPALRDRLMAPTAGGTAWRCLRCAAFVTGAPAPRRRRWSAGLRSELILRVFAVERFLRFLIIGAAAYGVWRFTSGRAGIERMYTNARPAIGTLYRDLGFDVHYSRLPGLIQHSFMLTPRTLTYLAIGLAGYAVIELVESTGLWLGQQWGGYFAMVATSIFLPYEVYDLTGKITWLRARGARDQPAAGHLPGLGQAAVRDTRRQEGLRSEAAQRVRHRGGRGKPSHRDLPKTSQEGAQPVMRRARLHRRRVRLGSFFWRIGRAACIVWPAPDFSRAGCLRRGQDGSSGRGTDVTEGEAAAMKEPDVSRPARAGGGAVQSGGLAEGVDLLVSGGGGLADLFPRRLVTVWARRRSVMRVRAWRAQPDARPGARWGRWLLIAGDAALAVALAAAFYLATEAHYDDRPAGIALILLQTLPLAVRRRYPLSVLAVVAAATLGTVAAEIPGRPNGGAGVVLMVALYSVAAHCPRREAAWAGIAAGAALAWPLGTATAGIAPAWARLLAAVVSLVLPALGWLCGAYVSELRGRAARSRREQELETGRAVAEEQARVGRELHDVIAHTLSVIVIQAGAAADVFDARPQAARQALGSIGAAGRQALAELRRVLAAVRPQPGEPDGWAPPPGLSGLGELLDRVRAAGLDVTARIDGTPVDLPAGLDLAAYRIVQEALTNTLKHARADNAEVNLCYEPAGLALAVTDDGRAAAPAGRPGPARGRGLIGIGERAALHGGTCQAGPRPGGGFAVRVSFPLPGDGPS